MGSSKPIVYAVLLGILSWAALGLANFNADYLLDLNASSRKQSWMQYAIKNKFGLWESLAPNALVIYLLPVISIVLLSNSKQAVRILLSIIFVLFFANLFQLFSLEGGDRKGCEGCFGLILIHIIFGLLSLSLACIYLFICQIFGTNLAFNKRRRQKINAAKIK